MELTYASSSLPNLSAAATMPHRAVKIIPLEHPSPSTPSSSPPQLSSAVSKWTARMKQKTFDEWIEMFVPCYRWIRIYNWNDYLQADLMAGVTVGVMLVPQVYLSITIMYMCVCVCLYICTVCLLLCLYGHDFLLFIVILILRKPKAGTICFDARKCN